jgi:hypothetical protein
VDGTTKVVEQASMQRYVLFARNKKLARKKCSGGWTERWFGEDSELGKE